ncbi:TPA: hypothetical protein DCE37_21990 [Candidatus Latescibacteria bacterium]|nr:hypothetical protein [Candidatus Latescibacterota bacterium]
MGATIITSDVDALYNRTDSLGNAYRERPWNVHSRLRTMVGARLAREVWLYGGLSFSVLTKEDDDPVLIRPRGDYAKHLNNQV